jgi:hypothetical protein
MSPHLLASLQELLDSILRMYILFYLVQLVLRLTKYNFDKQKQEQHLLLLLHLRMYMYMDLERMME